MGQLFDELKRRNVIRVAMAYLAASWLILQAADIVLDNIAAPDWLMRALMFFMAIGFPIAVIFAWAFEMTPEGIKKEADVDRSASITTGTGKKLDRMIIGVLGAAVVFLLVDKFLLSNAYPDVAASDKSVAVLPFVAMSSGPDDEYFADGLTEEILNSLTRLPELLVTARTSAFYFKGQNIPVPEIAASLGVAHVVEGSVRRDGDRLRVTAQLIRAGDGFHLWSANYDRKTEDTFGVQTDIAEKIAVALDVVMDDEQRESMREAGIRNPEAFVAFQKGRELFAQAHGSANMLEALHKSNDWFDLALEIEPGFPDAYLYRADYFTHFLMNFINSEDVTAEERNLALDRLTQDHTSAIGLASGDADRISAEYDLAVITGEWRKLPALLDGLKNATGCTLPSWLLETSVPYGWADTALHSGLEEIKCNPMSFSGWVSATASNLYLGNFDTAIETANRGIETTPHIRIYQALFFAYLAASRFDEAASVIDRQIHRDNQSLPLRVMLSAARGDADLARTQLIDVIELGDDAVRPPLAQLAVTGDRAAANEMAAQLDALPNGHLVLMVIPTVCRCGAPFDLEATPNFAKLIEEAEFPWPPVSPINWPLKDW